MMWSFEECKQWSIDLFKFCDKANVIFGPPYFFTWSKSLLWTPAEINNENKDFYIMGHTAIFRVGKYPIARKNQHQIYLGAEERIIIDREIPLILNFFAFNCLMDIEIIDEKIIRRNKKNVDIKINSWEDIENNLEYLKDQIDKFLILDTSFIKHYDAYISRTKDFIPLLKICNNEKRI